MMGDKGGKKDKDKSQKQKTLKHVHEIQQKKDNQTKSTFETNISRSGQK